MELFLLFALFWMQKGGAPEAALKDFLSFYRENRDLIRLFSGTAASPDAPAGNDGRSEKESGAPEKSGDAAGQEPDLNILEEYLKRSAAP